MIWKFHKGADLWIVENKFHLRDFDCHCTFADCFVTLVDSDLVNGLVQLEEKVGPFGLHRGYSCSTWNEIKKGKSGSYHLIGKAADPKVTSSLSAKTIARAAESISVFRNGGIGVGPSQIHVDARGYRARWTYP